MPSNIRIEVCVDSVQSALAAVKGGADRLEVCANLPNGGGTTPSLGLVRSIQKSIPGKIPIMTMIRPRTGSFLYSEAELDVMLQDIDVFKTAGVSGVVFGVLTASGYVDIERTKILVAKALPMEVCFHRAFDMSKDPWNSVASIPGITRILTSGHGQTAVSPSSLAQLLELHKQAQALSKRDPSRSITILPGSGINPNTVQILLAILLPAGLQEIHLSGGRFLESEMVYRREDMGMGGWGVWQTDEQMVSQVRQIVDKVTAN